MEACPYDVRIYLENDNHYIEHAVGDYQAREHVVDTVEKCMFCENKIERKEGPACMIICPMRARFWGDIDDELSEISQLLLTRDYEVLVEEADTKPNVYYLV
jgi:molybdopterin-containing oxidoreductase family iron-sulfur binding subunit